MNSPHPETHEDMHSVIADLVVRFVPLWERVSSETAVGYVLPAQTQDHYTQIWTRDPSFFKAFALFAEMEDWEYNQVAGVHGMYVRDGEARAPELLGPFKSCAPAPVVNLKGRILHIIVKLANLTSYLGGSWHVEGMVNEAIFATGIYYYDEENVQKSKLAFRAAVAEPQGYAQRDEIVIREIWGVDRQTPLVQIFGAVETSRGRCLAFPNIYQYQVQPFELADSTTRIPGYREIVALFLVDPDLKAPRPSTALVLPQRKDWMRLSLFGIARGPDSGLSCLCRLPNEILDLIVDLAVDLMDRTEAERHREELMKERRVMIQTNTEVMLTLSLTCANSGASGKPQIPDWRQSEQIPDVFCIAYQSLPDTR
ncbi:hypothetical protein K488DRAFT_73225 [Vararia minispora EC-137]|uniref:Uncharacterized protein n=1 Tax=Vararia minispora EC-137 TaxID=1314806 RepID=A0ACB8QBR8_9AGAM|nr:hypothetical protein K488DRAFT_73225 [Vararia minispora EC-137]